MGGVAAMAGRRPAVAAAAVALALGGCAGPLYYARLAGGHLARVAAARPVEAVRADPRVPEGVRARRSAEAPRPARAARELALPADGGAYTRYVDLGGRWPAWAVFAAPRLRMAQLAWCHPVVGCLGYRGFLDESRARAFARRLRARGLDVHVAPAAAYSTLGWAGEPLTDSMLAWPEPELAALLFHELAHRRVYAPGDTAFNEAYATAVQRAGVRRWLARRGLRAALARWEREEAMAQAMAALVARYRRRLAAAYAAPGTARERLAARRALLRALRAEYLRLRARLGTDAYDAWALSGLNNAKLLAFATYRERVPAFECLLRAGGGDLRRFHARVARLAALAPPARAAALDGACLSGPGGAGEARGGSG